MAKPSAVWHPIRHHLRHPGSCGKPGVTAPQGERPAEAVRERSAAGGSADSMPALWARPQTDESVKPMQKHRIISPAGFLFVLLCFALPFLSVSCESEAQTVGVNYTGIDFIAGGKPDVIGSLAGTSWEKVPSPDPQPLAFLALFSIFTGIAFVFVSDHRARALAGTWAGSFAAAFLVSNQLVAHSYAVAELRKSPVPPDAIEDMVKSRIGFWLALVLLLAVVGYNAFEIIRERAGLAGPRKSRPKRHDRQPTSHLGRLGLPRRRHLSWDVWRACGGAVEHECALALVAGERRGPFELRAGFLEAAEPE